MAPLGPLATIVSNASPSAPRSTMARSRATAKPRSVWPGLMESSRPSKAALVIAHALASRSSSDSSLIIRRLSIK